MRFVREKIKWNVQLQNNYGLRANLGTFKINNIHDSNILNNLNMNFSKKKIRF